jgi:2-aminoadipate transaminase
VEIAKRWSLTQRIHVIADEAYRDLRYEGSDVPSTLTVDDDGDTVAVTGTFSKSFSPGIRVGWGILPEHLVEPVCSQKGNIDFGSPNFSQYLIHRVLQLGLFAPHLEGVRESYRRKLRAMLEALEAEFGGMSEVDWIRPSGGLYVWLRLPRHLSAHPDAELFNAALREKVLYVPGGYCYPPSGEPAQHNTLRLSFGVQSPEKIREGVASLARAVRSVWKTAKRQGSHS